MTSLILHGHMMQMGAAVLLQANCSALEECLPASDYSSEAQGSLLTSSGLLLQAML